MAAVILIAMAAFVKHIGERVNSPTIVFFEGVVTLFILLFFLSPKEEFLRAKHLYLNFFRSLGFVLSALFYFLSLRFIPIMDVALIDNFKSLIIPIIALFWFKERITLWMWVVIGCGFIGVWIMLNPHGNSSSLGHFYALIQMLAAAFALSIVRRLANSQSYKTYLFFTFLFTTLITLPQFLLSFSVLTWEIIPYLLLIAVLSIGYQYCIFKGYNFATASQLAPFFYFQLPLAALIDWMFFHRVPGMHTLVGGLIIVLSGLGMIYLQRGAYEKA